jgi:hypothetical protein
MPKIIKIAGWEKKKDPKKGKKLQILANRMIMEGDVGTKYLRIRRAAEYHLGFWDWQMKGPTFGKTKVVKKGKKGLYPKKCVALKCPNLPAGSKRCTSPDNDCP